MVAYALLRYNVFGLDYAVKRSIGYGFVVGTFVLAFFVATEAAEALFEQLVGEIVGFVAAGALAVAVRPLEALGERIAQRAMPATKALDRLTSREREALFHDQMNLALQDGTLTEKEQRMLAALHAKLGLRGQATPSP